jgi:hypothetical protein
MERKERSMETVTILTAHAEGTAEVLRACLASIDRHDAGCPFKMLILIDSASKKAAEEVAKELEGYTFANCLPLELSEDMYGSAMHACLLDAAVFHVDTKYILTLDSDCFPVADGWLADLMGEYDQGNVLPGIVWPWIPIRLDENPLEMERRIRGYHNWRNTQVACQLVKTEFLDGLRYEASDDTGFALLDKAHELDLNIDGWIPTMCALPDIETDPEFNREACVIFGDKMFHMGGATRKAQGAEVDPQGWYDGARGRVLEEKGAEWILEEGNHHKYTFEKEHLVVRQRMNLMYQCMRRYLEHEDRLFDPK